MGLIYTKMKVFHYPEKLASLPRETSEIRPPIQIRIKPTNVCNHNCRYCSYRMGGIQLGQDINLRDFIPRDKMLELVNNIQEIGVRSVLFSGGGEPFCYPYMLETLHLLANSSVKFAALTNGALVKGDVSDFFAHHGTWLRVSVDGWDDESYRRYRGCNEGEFTRILANLKNFRYAGGECYLGVNIVVDVDNAPHLYDMIKIFKDIGVQSAKISPCIVANSGPSNNEYHDKLFAMVKESICRAKSDFSDGDFEIFDSYVGQLESFEKDYSWCPYLQIVPVIGADSNVYVCHDKAYNLQAGLLGSIKSQSFKTLWNEDKSKFFQIKPKMDCNHHCIADTGNKMILEYLEADPRHLEFV